MILINDVEYKYDSYPDGTPKLDVTGPFFEQHRKDLNILTWMYDGEHELLPVYSLLKHYNIKHFIMPYVPHARYDRVRPLSAEVFTLKYLADIINSLNLNEVVIMDPHSDVTSALFNNVNIIPNHMLATVLEDELFVNKYRINGPSNVMAFYPDEGARKRYSGVVAFPYTTARKDRDWMTGEIKQVVIDNPGMVKDKTVIIVDDICSKGGTFFFAAEKLKEAGAGPIILAVTHCEDSIHEGKLESSGLISHVYTTNSIYRRGTSEFMSVSDIRSMLMLGGKNND